MRSSSIGDGRFLQMNPCSGAAPGIPHRNSAPPLLLPPLLLRTLTVLLDLHPASADLNHLSDPPSSPEQWHALRKGINPRTRAQQLDDSAVSHLFSRSGKKKCVIFAVTRGKTARLLCPGELLVEKHNSNYGEPWAGGPGVFDFLARGSDLQPSDLVLEIGCRTLRVALPFIRYLDSNRFHCLERDELSLMAALRLELASQELLYKRPSILRGADMDFGKFGAGGEEYGPIYASAVFLHRPDKPVGAGSEKLAGRLKPERGRIFVSQNGKFCSRLGSEEFER